MKIRDARDKDWFWSENAIIDREDLDIYEKMGYLVLCRFSNRRNRCYPSIPTIAKKIRCSKRKAVQVLKSLNEKLLIGKTHRLSEHGDPTSNEYLIYSAKDNKDTGAVHDDNHPVQEVHDGDEGYTPEVVQAMHENNTYTEPSLITTTTEPVDVVSGKRNKIEEEYNEKTVTIPLPHKTVQQIIRTYTPHEPFRVYHAAWVLNWMIEEQKYVVEKGYENVLIGILNKGVIQPDKCPSPSEVRKRKHKVIAQQKALENKKLEEKVRKKALETEFESLTEAEKDIWRQQAKKTHATTEKVINIVAFNLWQEDRLKSGAIYSSLLENDMAAPKETS